jgi:hypothetical protein
MSFHQCDEQCVCPVHRTQMLYAPATDDHACQDIECKYAHGFHAVRVQEVWDLLDDYYELGQLGFNVMGIASGGAGGVGSRPST